MKARIKAFGEVMMRLEVPDYKKIEQSNQLEYMYTGTAVNFLATLQQFGYKTALITRLPETSIGHGAYRHIQSLGIDKDHISFGGQFLGMYFLEKGYSLRPTKVTYTDRQSSSFNTASLNDYNFNEILKDATHIHFCGIALAISEETREIALNLAKKAKEENIKVIFDSNYRPKLWKNDYRLARPYYEEMLQCADIVFMSDKDAHYLLQFESEKEDSEERLEDLLRKVANTYNIGTIACTIRGENDLTRLPTIKGFLLNRNQVSLSKLYDLNVLDRIGAGDAFASGIVHGVIEGYSNEHIVDFATASGVLAHTIHGDTPLVTKEEVWNLMEQAEQIDIER